MAKVNLYKWIKGIGLLVLLCFNLLSFGQKKHELIVYPIDKDSGFISTQLHLTTQFTTPIQCEEYLQKLPAQLRTAGYVAASIDSVSVNDTQTIVHLFLGDKLQWDAITIKEADQQLLQSAGVKATLLNKHSVTYNEYEQVQQKLLNYFENNGYPFASVTLDNVLVNDGRIVGELLVDRGTVYKVDSIRLMGSAKLSRNFIHRYLNLERGGLYQKNKLDKINQRLLELPYLEQARPWDLSMLNTGSVVNLYLQPKRSNQVNVLAGFLPANEQIGGKLLFTIDANLQLQNAFAAGEKIGVVWQQIQPKSPRLNLNYTQPYLFNSPYGVDFLFELFKRDSSFLNINGQIGMLYMVSPNKTGKVSIQNTRTNVLDIDTFRVKSFRQLPDVADVSAVNLALEYDVNNTNYRFNPRKGTEYSFAIAIGNKKIRKNNAITQIKSPDFDYNRLYDTIQLNTFQIRLRAKAAKYFPLGKQAVIKTGANLGWYESPNFFRNELFQIGGHRLLRGFDEEAIFASKYAVGTLEYRYLLGLNSNFFAFTDFGMSENGVNKVRNSYLGGGIGLSFETKGGIFNISYAAGKRNDLPFDIRQSKIHFGFVSIF